MSESTFERAGTARPGHIVTGIRYLTESAFVLSFTRCGLSFRAGQHLIAGIAGEMDQREYSIYSGENDSMLEILVREVSEGNISLRLGSCEPGQKLNINGPFGAFVIDETSLMSKKHVFIATGTGISPFHSIVRSHPGIDYLLVHGVRLREEAYERDAYDPGRYVLCTSGEPDEGGQGRVSAFLGKLPVNDDMLFYLCGNSGMIHDVKTLLQGRGITRDRIFTEVYF